MKYNLSEALSKEIKLDFFNKIHMEKVFKTILKKRIKYKDYAMYFNIFSVLLHSGQTMKNSLVIMRNSIGNKQLRNISNNILESLEEGKSISSAMKPYFNSFVINMIEISSEGSNLYKGFENLSIYYKDKNEIKMMLIKTLTYPLLITISTISVTVFLMTSIVPSLGETLISMGGNIPSITMIILNMSKFIRNNGQYILILIAILIGLFVYVFNKPKVKEKMLELNIVKMFFNRYVESDISSEVVMLMKSGYDLYKSLKTTFVNYQNKFIRDRLISSLYKIQSGESIGLSLKSVGIFSDYFLGSVEMGMNTGNLLETLDDINCILKSEYKNRLAIISEIISPILICVLGLIVGVIVISIMLPIMTLGSTIK